MSATVSPMNEALRNRGLVSDVFVAATIPVFYQSPYF